MNDISRAPTRHLIHNCRCHFRNLLDARGDFIGYWRFILQLWKISALKCCHGLALSETWFIISHQFQGLEVSHTISLRLISMKFIQEVHSTIPSIHRPKIIFIEIDYHMSFNIKQKRPLLLARSLELQNAIPLIHVIHQLYSCRGWESFNSRGAGTFVYPCIYRSQNRHWNLWAGQYASSWRPLDWFGYFLHWLMGKGMPYDGLPFSGTGCPVLDVAIFHLIWNV